MKRTRFRSNIIFLLGVLFIIGTCFFVYNLLTNAQLWANMPYNGHFSDEGIANASKITDRYGNVLAYSTDGERKYNENESVRRAMLHVVGDNSTNISTAIQSIYRSKLTGYNYLFGLGMPDKLKGASDIKLTYDSSACAQAYEALAGRKGAVIVYNYKNGEILCSVSTPSYDPENPPEISEDDSEYDGVYLDRTISVSYAPGSTFKLVTLNAALENIPDVQNRTFHCSGSTDIDGSPVTCMESHGDLTLKDALASSCNIVFAQLACEVGGDKMTEYAQRLGITKSYLIDGNPTKAGNYNVKKANKNELAWSGIGQYTDAVCPMNTAILSGAIARGGSSIIPHGISSNALIDLSSVFNGGETLMSASSAQTIGEMMRYTVSNHYGDGNFPSLTVCAKTGTAETGDDTEPHGWITGYTLDEDCPLAFACVVENGGLGFYSAGQVIAQTLETLAYNIRNAE